MISRTGFPGIAVAVLAAALACSIAGFAHAQSAESAKGQPEQVQAKPEEIVPGPQNIKEHTAIYVFLGWMWISIAVSVYILRLKIKEIDRVYNLRFFPTAEQLEENTDQPSH